MFQDRSEKRIIEIRIRSRIQSLFILATYTVGLTVEVWDLNLPAVVLWDNHRSIGPVEGQFLAIKSRPDQFLSDHLHSFLSDSFDTNESIHVLNAEKSIA